MTLENYYCAMLRSPTPYLKLSVDSKDSPCRACSAQEILLSEKGRVGHFQGEVLSCARDRNREPRSFSICVETLAGVSSCTGAWGTKAPMLRLCGTSSPSTW